MAGEEDPPWETEFDTDDTSKKTVVDQPVLEEAVPAVIASRDTTGKYKTLPGHGTADVQSELAFGRGCAHCTRRLLIALEMRMVESGATPAVAAAQVAAFQRWMDDPAIDERIRAAMKR